MRAYDPVAAGTARRIYGHRAELVLCGSRDAALKGADALAVLTDWREFCAPDFGLVKGLLRRPVIFDGRNVCDPGTLRAMGFDYFPVGRPPV